ncbi:uncharacterized protein LOC117931437 isoform X2 [Vitis riparia]|uniref:uncharacterized protein LOC117931437 isoform X2 n=1 Tax=Vitis riparia TaxID=96939 RepID=UPI00155B1D85|nr:uncharacterized protein LOC117931437 isoform X2 [Vitis riparia]
MLFFYQMGCQASRLEQDEEGQPARPGLLRRFEDITWLRRSESIGKGTLSTKQLIEEQGGEDEEGSAPKHSDKDVSHIPVVSIGLVEAPSLDEVNVKIVESRYKKEEKEEERDKGRVDDWDDRGDQDDEGWLSDREDHLFYPRSPSFREYCINCYSRELDKDDGHVKGAKREKKKSQRKEGTASPIPNEGSRPKSPKKGLKRRSFRKVLKKDGSIKNLWNVSAWYNPSFSSSQDGPQKEGAKAS